jgi:hypothetical protein
MQRPVGRRRREDLLKVHVRTSGEADDMLGDGPDLDEPSLEVIPVHVRRPGRAAECLQNNRPDSQGPDPSSVPRAVRTWMCHGLASPLSKPDAEVGRGQPGSSKPDLAPVRRRGAPRVQLLIVRSRDVMSGLQIDVLAHAACLHEPRGELALFCADKHPRAPPDHLREARQHRVFQVVHPSRVARQAGDAQLLSAIK